jgi:hypothetical protein
MGLNSLKGSKTNHLTTGPGDGVKGAYRTLSNSCNEFGGGGSKIGENVPNTKSVKSNLRNIVFYCRDKKL